MKKPTEEDNAYIEFMLAVMVAEEAYKALNQAEQNAFDRQYTREELITMLKRAGIKARF